MGLAILKSRAQLGTDAPPVTIEVFLSGGLPTFSIVGMAETAVRESKDRVRGAIISSGFSFPQERITVNLGPADMRKTGGRFDLAIALGILAASKLVPATAFENLELYGELRGDEVLAAIDMGAEVHPLIAYPAQVGQAEDLVAPAIGKQGARPAHEAMKTP